jgi:aminopeptidase N
VHDAVRDALRPVHDLMDLVVTALPAETHVVVVEDVLRLARGLVDRYLEPTDRREALLRIAGACDAIIATASPRDQRRLAGVRGLVGSTVDVDRLRGWLGGAAVPDGIAVDVDLRWRMLQRLVVLGAAGEPEIAEEFAADRSATGEEWATRCRAALPDPAAKERAWRALIEDTTISNRLVEANAAGFWQPEQLALTEGYVARYFAEMPAMAARRTPWLTERAAMLAFPHYAVAPDTRAAAARLLADERLDPGLRRAVTDADDDLGRALTARALTGARGRPR